MSICKEWRAYCNICGEIIALRNEDRPYDEIQPFVEDTREELIKELHRFGLKTKGDEVICEDCRKKAKE